MGRKRGDMGKLFHALSNKYSQILEERLNKDFEIINKKLLCKYRVNQLLVGRPQHHRFVLHWIEEQAWEAKWELCTCQGDFERGEGIDP